MSPLLNHPGMCGQDSAIAAEAVKSPLDDVTVTLVDCFRAVPTSFFRAPEFVNRGKAHNDKDMEIQTQVDKHASGYATCRYGIHVFHCTSGLGLSLLDLQYNFLFMNGHLQLARFVFIAGEMYHVHFAGIW